MPARKVSTCGASQCARQSTVMSTLSSLIRKVRYLHHGVLMRIGLGSFDATATHDVKIFSLAILLSSYFIYNSMGTIDENALDKLSYGFFPWLKISLLLASFSLPHLYCRLVTHLTEHIQLRTKAKEQDSAQLAKYFPRFLWVVRDFSLQLKDESGSSISEAEYVLLRAQLPLYQTLIFLQKKKGIWSAR